MNFIKTAVKWPARIVFHICVFPICAVVALMDSNNGRGFWKNYGTVTGADWEKKSRDIT
jgi:hypothetical protein